MDTPKTNVWLPPIAFVEEGWSRKLSHTSLLTCDGPLLGVPGEWWAQKCLPCPSLCSLHAHVLLGRVKRTAEKRTNPWHSNLARRPLVRLLANKCLHLLLHNPHFPPLTTSNGKFSLQWQNITYVVYALFQSIWWDEKYLLMNLSLLSDPDSFGFLSSDYRRVLVVRIAFLWKVDLTIFLVLLH